MIWELVYTSLERGLKGGKSGFGIAAATVGIPEVIAQTLCAGSGYTPFYPPHTPEYNSNPVSDFHSIARIGDTAWHWVGRIRAWGMDYSGRSNLLAHHLFFTSDEISGALPETLLDDCAELGLIELDAFTGPARWLEPLKGLPPGRNIAAGGAWREALGDAGWAGVPAECAVSGRTPVYIAVKPGADVRSMLRESIRLLPPEMRWRTTYNTYYTRASGDVRCDWRFCLDEDKLLTAARRQPGSIVIDGVSAPPETAWTRFARGSGPSPVGGFRSAAEEICRDDLPISLKPLRNPVSGMEAPPAPVSHVSRPEMSFREIRRGWWAAAWILSALLILAAVVSLLVRDRSEELFEIPDFEDTVDDRSGMTAVSVPLPTGDFMPSGGEGAEDDGLLRERFKDLPGAAEVSAPPAAVPAGGAGSGSVSGGRGGKIILASSPTEEPPAAPRTASAPLLLPPAPEVLKDLPGRIWRLCAVGEPGASVSLGSGLAPEVKPIPGTEVSRAEDGSLILTAADGSGLCVFKAPEQDSGEWRLELTNHFLPGLSGFSGMSWRAEDAVRPVTMAFEGCLLSASGRFEYDRSLAAGLVWTEDDRLFRILESSGVLADNGLVFYSGGAARPDPLLAARLEKCGAVLAEYEKQYAAENEKEISELTAGLREIAARRESYCFEREEDLAELEAQRPAEMTRPSGNPPDEIRRRWLNYERQLKAWNKKYDDFNRETEKTLAVFDEKISEWQAALAAARARTEEIVYPEELRDEIVLLKSELDRKAAAWEGMEGLRIAVTENVCVEIVSGRGE